MLSLKSLTAFLALGVLSATAVPANVVETKAVAGRANTVQVYACEHSEWRGVCKTFTSNAGACYNLGKDWNDRISSIQNLQKSNYKCTWWQHGDCKGESYNNQEDANLADGNGWWNDRISAWRCQ